MEDQRAVAMQRFTDPDGSTWRQNPSTSTWSRWDQTSQSWVGSETEPPGYNGAPAESVGPAEETRQSWAGSETEPPGYDGAPAESESPEAGQSSTTFVLGLLALLVLLVIVLIGRRYGRDGSPQPEGETAATETRVYSEPLRRLAALDLPGTASTRARQATTQLAQATSQLGQATSQFARARQPGRAQQQPARPRVRVITSKGSEIRLPSVPIFSSKGSLSSNSN